MYDYLIVAVTSGGRLAATRLSHDPDGTVVLPEALLPYFRGADRITANPGMGR